MIRVQEREHSYHQVLHDVAETTERLLTVVLLVLLGGAIVDGVMSGLGWEGAITGLVIVLVLRPVAGFVSLVGTSSAPGERAAIAFFGVRGIGSIYYLAYALNKGDFADASTVWAVVAFVILLSVVLHGVTAFTVMRRLDDSRAASRGG